MAAKDYMVDVSKVPDYGPPNMAAQLYGMIRGIPQAYQQGIENQYANQKAQFEQELQPYKKAEIQRADIKGRYVTKDLIDYFTNPKKPTDSYDTGEGDSPRATAPDAKRVQNNTGGGGLFDPVPGARAPGQEGSINHLIDTSPTKIGDPDAVATKLSKMLGVDPNEPLDPEQRKAVSQALSWEQPDATASVNPTLPGGMPPFDPRGAPPNIQPGEGGGPATAMAQAPMGPGGPQDPGAAPGAGGPPMPPQGHRVGSELLTGQVPLSPGVPTTNPAAGMTQFLPPTAPQRPPPGADAQPWNQARINRALTEAQNKMDEAGRVKNWDPGRAEGMMKEAEMLKEHAKQMQEALIERNKLTGEQKNVRDPVVQADITRRKIQEGDIAESRKEQVRLQSNAMAADRGNQQLASMRTVMSDPNFYSGPAHEAVGQYRAWLAVLPGGDPNAASPMQEFKKTSMALLNERIQSAVQSGYSRIQIREIDNMKAQIANLDVTADTNRYIMEEMRRIHLMDIKLNRFANEYAQTHQGYLDRGWPAAKDEFMNRPENRLFTQREIDHPASIAPSYFPKSMYGDVAKTKEFIKRQGLKDSDPVVVDDSTKPLGPDGLPQRKLIDARHLLKITVQ